MVTLVYVSLAFFLRKAGKPRNTARQKQNLQQNAISQTRQIFLLGLGIKRVKTMAEICREIPLKV